MSFEKLKYLVFGSLLAIPFISLSWAVENADDVNKANNPLTQMMGINFHDYYTSSIYGSDDDSNTLFLRGVIPHKLGGLKQISRLSLPYVKLPNSRDNVDGFGDVNLFDIFLLDPVNGYEFGVGPYFVFPTASKDEAGTGLWQAGLSATVIKQTNFGLIGSLLTYQHDVAGPSELPTQNILTFQPLLNIHMPMSFYFRSTGILNFDLDKGHYVIPLGAGIGKVFKLQDEKIMNLFVEPQWTIAHNGDVQPEFQTFVGFNMQFPF